MGLAVSTAALISALLGPPVFVLPAHPPRVQYLAPPPINFSREILEIDNKRYEIEHLVGKDSEKVVFKELPRADFWGGGGKPPKNKAHSGDGNDGAPFEVGDKVYFTPDMTLGLGVVAAVKDVGQHGEVLWWVKADFLTAKGWLTKMAVHTKFKKAYTEEQ